MMLFFFNSIVCAKFCTGASVVVVDGLDVQVELLAHNALVDGEHLLVRRFEVGRGVVARSDVQVLRLEVVDRLMQVAHLHEHLLVAAEQVKSRPNLFLGIGSLDSRGNNADVEVLGAHSMGVRDHRDVDVYKFYFAQRYLPEPLFSCFWGRMIWMEATLLVSGIGWSRIQMARMTLPTILVFFMSRT